ncbi:hypothetical protein QVD17_17826 [Tagetes erecta]|uniref:DUF4283 domain-containing protein n=1 Tax=Tagetes erecta TaxID=13708 RepID=A0AAD8NUP5_TARER|nr:hypothetical protein QVD17_17826 [Tagetes erecta]
MSDFIKSAENFVRSESAGERRFFGNFSKDAIRVPLMDISNSGADIHSFHADIKPVQQINTSIDPSSEDRGFAAASIPSGCVNQVRTDQIHQGNADSIVHDAMESTDYSHQSSMANFTNSNAQIEAAIIDFVDGTCTDPVFMAQMKDYIAQNILDPGFEARYGKILQSKPKLTRSACAVKRAISAIDLDQTDEVEMNVDKPKCDGACTKHEDETEYKRLHVSEIDHNDVHSAKLTAVKNEIEFEKFKSDFNKAKSPLQVLNSGFSVGIESDIVDVTPSAAIETMPMKDKVSVKAMKKRIDNAWKQDKKRQPLLKKSSNLFTNSVQKSWSNIPHVKNVSFTTTGEGIKIDVIMDEVKSEVKTAGSYANAVSGQKKVDYTKLIDPVVYCPPKVLENGEKVAVIEQCFIEKAKIEYKTQLYGYFVGLELNLKFVRANLYKMWRKFGIVSIMANGAGVFFFKFRSEEGLNEVLKLGPWAVDGVPLCLHKWNMGVRMVKVEPENIPIWTTFTNLPLELWNAKCICQLASCIGKPLVFDNVTAEKCVKPNGAAGFARVLIEINAKDQLMEKVRAIYPSDELGRDENVFVNVKYQQHPPKCVHCHVFGHSLIECKKKPFAESKPVLSQFEKQCEDDTKKFSETDEDDGFQEVGNNGKPRKNGPNSKPSANQMKGSQSYSMKSGPRKGSQEGRSNQNGVNFAGIDRGTDGEWKMHANSNKNKGKHEYRVVNDRNKKNEDVSVKTMNHFEVLADDMQHQELDVEEKESSEHVLSSVHLFKPYPAISTASHPAKQSPSPHPAKQSPPPSPHPAQQPPPPLNSYPAQQPPPLFTPHPSQQPPPSFSPHPAQQPPSTSTSHPATQTLHPAAQTLHPAQQPPPSSSPHPAQQAHTLHPATQTLHPAREINRAGLNLRNKVCEVVNGNSWVWPDGWNVKFPMLYLHGPPEIKPGMKDKIAWLTNRGKSVNFSIKTAFEDLCVTQPDVDWRKIVWLDKLYWYDDARINAKDELQTWKIKQRMGQKIYGQHDYGLENG